MSTIQTYVREYIDGKAAHFPVWKLLDEKPIKDPTIILQPGDTVCHTTRGGYGMVVAVHDDVIVILWSEAPAPDTFANTVFPVVRRATPTLIASQLVSIQPMTAPSGALFYMDYAYGSGPTGPSSGSCPSQAASMGPTVGRQNNREPSNKVAIGSRGQYLGPPVRGPRRGKR